MQFSNYKNKLETSSLQLINYGRVALYTIESFPIVALKKIFNASAPLDPKPPADHQKLLKKTVDAMINQDLLNVQNGIYPRTLLYPENPVKHFTRYKDLVFDAIKSTIRQKNNKHKEFSEDSTEYLGDLPDYYKRNFHFQTDGYLSLKSAELYSHQTEILFKGTISLMRRVLMAELISHINERANRPLRVLELGCGAGEATEILLKSCKNIEILAIDPSEPYLSYAKKRLSDFKNVDFERSFAEDFKSRKKFDVVFSSYLFHELPLKVRELIFETSKSLLKKNAISFHIDSLQLNDNVDFNWALIQFPKVFHEPFYANYIKTPLEELQSKTLSFHSVNHSFLSKSVMAINS